MLFADLKEKSRMQTKNMQQLKELRMKKSKKEMKKMYHKNIFIQRNTNGSVLYFKHFQLFITN